MDSMRYQDDLYYLEQTRQGDLQAFGMLVEKHERHVFTLCLRMLKNREEAEEAAQDSFVKSYQHLNSFSGNSKFTTWLFRITYNECLGRLRKKKIQFSIMEEITENEDAHLDWKNGLERLIQEERDRVIKSAIEKLSSQEAAVITLFYLDELPIKEIIGITDLTESNIKVVLHRARKKLANLLQADTEKNLMGIR